MRRSRFSEEQVIGALKQRDVGIPATELCRQHGALRYVAPAEYRRVIDQEVTGMAG